MNKPKLPDPVGYKHPPRAHQFQPGESGNPAGRPKGVRSLKADLREELAELIHIEDGNQTVELSKQRVLIKRLVGAAVEGDARAVATVLSLTLRAFSEEEHRDQEEAPEDREIMQVFASGPARSTTAKAGPAHKNIKDEE